MATSMTIKDESKKVFKAVDAAMLTCVKRAAQYVAGIAKRSIGISPDKSEPGKPPHSRKGLLKRAIRWSADTVKAEAVIGPTISAVGKIGHTHEFGGTEPPKVKKARKANFVLEIGGHGPLRVTSFGAVGVGRLRTGRQLALAKEIAASLPARQAASGSAKTRKYPPRPFMGPALERSKARLPAFWANSVKGG